LDSIQNNFMVIVSNTTPISELAKVEQLQLLQDVFGQVIIPQEVYDELMVGNHPAVLAMQSANWIQVRSLRDRFSLQELQTQTNLDLGECAAILLAEELEADRLIIDERAARQIAKSRRLPVIGTVGVLLLAKQRDLRPSVKDILDAMIDKGTRISAKLYQQALLIAEEE
jgi:uncharacterized protein